MYTLNTNLLQTQRYKEADVYTCIEVHIDIHIISESKCTRINLQLSLDIESLISTVLKRINVFLGMTQLYRNRAI